MNEALQLLLQLFAGWVSRQQLDVIDYLQEENRVLREQLGGRRLRLTDAQRRRLAVRGKAIGRTDRGLDRLPGAGRGNPTPLLPRGCLNASIAYWNRTG